MDIRASVSGRRFRLDPGDFESKVVQECPSLSLLLVLAGGIMAQDFTWYRKALAEDQVGRASADVWFNSGAYGQ